MALVEVGYPPESVMRISHNGVVRVDVAVERIDVWRATSIARGAVAQICWACREPLGLVSEDEEALLVAARDRCLADRPCVRDCGVQR